MHPRAAELIAALDLRPHPEGGYYREIYRSDLQVIPPDGRGPRAALTTIYFLLPNGMHSRWHQVRSDEVWHLYDGGPLELLELRPDGSDLTRHWLTVPSAPGGGPVHTVRANDWQAAQVTNGYALVGCTVAPGFEFADFRLLADDTELSARIRARWPEAAALI
jgi:uncharacterized protein